MSEITKALKKMQGTQIEGAKKQPRKVDPGNEVKSLEDYVRYAKDLGLKGRDVIYINNDLHTLLLLIKKKKGINIGELVGAITTDFFEKHKQEIKELIPNTF